MNLFAFVKSWKDFSFLWTLLQPFILKLLKKNVPTSLLHEGNKMTASSSKKYKCFLIAVQNYKKYVKYARKICTNEKFLVILQQNCAKKS